LTQTKTSLFIYRKNLCDKTFCGKVYAYTMPLLVLFLTTHIFMLNFLHFSLLSLFSSNSLYTLHSHSQHSCCCCGDGEETHACYSVHCLWWRIQCLKGSFINFILLFYSITYTNLHFCFNLIMSIWWFG
jgi:hypothetical protein